MKCSEFISPCSLIVMIKSKELLHIEKIIIIVIIIIKTIVIMIIVLIMIIINTCVTHPRGKQGGGVHANGHYKRILQNRIKVKGMCCKVQGMCCVDEKKPITCKRIDLTN